MELITHEYNTKTRVCKVCGHKLGWFSTIIFNLIKLKDIDCLIAHQKRAEDGI